MLLHASRRGGLPRVTPGMKERARRGGTTSMTVTVTPTVQDVYHQKKTETKALTYLIRDSRLVHVLARIGIEIKLNVWKDRTPNRLLSARHRRDQLRFVGEDVSPACVACVNPSVWYV